MPKHLLLYPFLLLAIILSSCMEESLPPVTNVDLYGSRGVFVINEGNFLYGNASLSYYDFDSRAVINNIFSSANGLPLGDVAYSMQIHNGLGYIVVNNSGCIHVVNVNTLELKATITGLSSPRHIYSLPNNRALVSDLYARAISIVDTEINEVIGTITTGTTTMPFHQHSTEALVRIGDEIFTNCWSYDSLLLVIDIPTLTVIDSIPVGIQPSALAVDAREKLWVLNDGGYPGNPFGHEQPTLIRVNPTTRTVEHAFELPTSWATLGGLALNPGKDTLYVISTDLYALSIEESVLPDLPLIPSNNRNFRAVAVDPMDGTIFLADAIDFMSEGTVYVYSPKGMPIDTFEVGIIPGGFCFN